MSLPITSQSALAANKSSSSKQSHNVVATSHGKASGTVLRRSSSAYVTRHVAYSSKQGRIVRKTAYVRGRTYARRGGISCVPYARSESGITVAGNAWQWWDNAAGVYARGQRPEAGGVLSFTANGRMRLGHVAVVARVINPREIEVDHANWAGGGVARNVPVVDVSENNDWTAVRVGLGRSGDFGSVYPTNGFIYDRPDNGTMVAAVKAPAPQPFLNPAPADLRPYVERAGYSQSYDEVAEAPPVRTTKHHVTHHGRPAPKH